LLTRSDLFFNLVLDVPVLSILVYSGIVLLPVLLPVAATGGALSTIPIPTNKSAQSAQNFSSIERLGMGNVAVSNHIMVFTSV
jgi:calcium permeable stress-gated cation channel